MSSLYHIQNVVSTTAGAYRRITWLAYLFRVKPDAKVLEVNGRAVANIYAPDGVSPMPDGDWTSTKLGNPGYPLIDLYLRVIVPKLPLFQYYNNFWTGRAKNISYASGYVWYYTLCQVDSTGTAILGNSQNGQLSGSIPILIDNASLALGEPTVVDGALFGLSETPNCPPVIVNRGYQNPLPLSIF